MKDTTICVVSDELSTVDPAAAWSALVNDGPGLRGQGKPLLVGEQCPCLQIKIGKSMQ